MPRDPFRVHERGSSVRTEIVGGITTFTTMAYIIVVNPAILSFAGLPTGPSTVATILAAAFGCIAMGLYANRPFAVAPYMGENAFIAFGLAALGITWQQRLGAVFWGGLLFAIITMLRIRPWLAAAISPSLKHSFAVGIGLFLALIGLYESGVVTSFVTGLPPEALALSSAGTLLPPGAPLKLGDVREPRVLLAVAGFLVMTVLLQRGIRGAILIGMAATAVVGVALGLASAPQALIAVPFRGEYSLSPIALQLDLLGVLRPHLLPVLLTLFLMGLLDTLGTLVALGTASGLADAEGNLPDIEKPMMVDAAACMFSGLVGTSTTGVYIESATGIRDGARTGLAAVTTGLLFLAALFFIPLVAPLQSLQYAYAPALVVVGLLMLESARHIAYEDMTELIPAFAAIALVVFTYNIANGLTAGLAFHPIVKVAAGRAREVRPGAWVLAAMSFLYYGFGLPH
jgi:AGZA family xanthine/uracil permease-like MFS transporter